MADFDSTKKRLNVDNMDRKDREALFNKFVNKGGKVVKDKNDASQNKSSGSKKQSSLISEDAKSNRSALLNERLKKGLIPDKKGVTDIKVGILTKLYIWWHAFTKAVVTFTSGKISSKFYYFVDKTALNALMESNELISGALYPPSESPEEANRKHNDIVEQMTNDEDMELIERFRMIYKADIYDSFLKYYSGGRRDLSFATDAYNLVKSMIKQIYITRLYVEQIKTAADKVFMAYGKIDKIKESVINNRMLLFRKDVNVIYEQFYPKLIALLQYCAGILLEKEEYFIEILNLSEEDRIGYYTLQKLKLKEIQFAELSKSKKASPEKSKDAKQDKITKIGLMLIKKIVDYSKIKQSIKDDTDLFYYVSENDKVFRSKCLFDTFDSEYSPFIISHKVKLNVIYDHNARVDYTSEFNSQIIAIAELRSKYNEYALVTKDIIKVENDKGINYSQRAILLNEKNSLRSMIAKKLRSSFVAIVTQMKKSIEKLMLDKTERERIIENPNDIVSFDVSIHGRKRLSGKKVIEGFTEIYYYIAGMYFLLVNGELSGAGIAIDESIREKEIEAKKDGGEENLPDNFTMAADENSMLQNEEKTEALKNDAAKKDSNADSGGKKGNNLNSETEDTIENEKTEKHIPIEKENKPVEIVLENDENRDEIETHDESPDDDKEYQMSSLDKEEEENEDIGDSIDSILFKQEKRNK